MKRLNLESVMNVATIAIGIVLMGLVIFNIVNHGIGNTASFEF